MNTASRKVDIANISLKLSHLVMVTVEEVYNVDISVQNNAMKKPTRWTATLELAMAHMKNTLLFGAAALA